MQGTHKMSKLGIWQTLSYILKQNLHIVFDYRNNNNVGGFLFFQWTQWQTDRAFRVWKLTHCSHCLHRNRLVMNLLFFCPVNKQLWSDWGVLSPSFHTLFILHFCVLDMCVLVCACDCVSFHLWVDQCVCVCVFWCSWGPFHSVLNSAFVSDLLNSVI